MSADPRGRQPRDLGQSCARSAHGGFTPPRDPARHGAGDLSAARRSPAGRLAMSRTSAWNQRMALGSPRRGSWERETEIQGIWLEADEGIRTLDLRDGKRRLQRALVPAIAHR
jgi:hypothetical protein